jgi:hypothetical protein
MKLKNQLNKIQGGIKMRSQYQVVGKISEISFNDLIVKEEKTLNIDKKKLKMVALAAATILIASALQDHAFAASTAGDVIHSFTTHGGEAIPVNGTYKAPSELKTLLSFIDWLIWLFRVIVSSVIGLIATYAGYKWSTDITGDGQNAAKKILKNCFVGAILVWTGTTIANYFVGVLNGLLG